MRGEGAERQLRSVVVVCAAGAVLHVLVAALAIKQNNDEASRKQKAAKAEKYKAKKNTKKKHRSKVV
jgi:alkyl hydroperoxide reductase subunit AhpC